MSSNKIKILLVGQIGENVDDFIKKLTSLQKSKAGPFDACFCVGQVDASIVSKANQLPIPVYLQDASNLITDKEGLVELAPNLHAFATAQVASIEIQKTQLVVVSCPPRLLWDTEASKPLQETLSHVSYVGCDLLLTSEWPQGVEQVLEGVASSTDQGSYDVAQVALQARPRYHVAPAHGKFLQSPPFTQLAATSSTFVPKHVGRFLCLGPVLSPAAFKQVGKSGKFVHALGITPLQYMTAQELVMPDGVMPNPYTDSSYQTTTTEASTSSVHSAGLSEAQARRLLSESTQETTTGDSHHRWATNKKRSRHDTNSSNTNHDEEDADHHSNNSNNTVLFLHGLHKDVRGVLQTGSAALLQAFAKYKVDRVRRPPGTSSYAFLEFPTHHLAQECLQDLNGQIVVQGIHLTLKWATKTPSSNNHTNNANKKRRLMEADAMDSSTVFYALPKSVPPQENAKATEELRVTMERTLEKALDDPTVTAETEPALQVKVRPLDDKNVGFLEFASHAAASMVLATLTSSTDGGLARDESNLPAKFLGVALHWAQDAKQPLEEHGGLRFQRKHFPADSRKDCWFCLASPTCEKHLVVSVHDECYIAMPKGPVHKGHALIVPVAHSTAGALVDKSIANEVESLTERLERHCSEKYDMDLFVFERAIQTKGGYHTHVQCIPIERGLGSKLQSTMVAMARRNPEFNLKELNSDLALSAMTNDDDDESGGYFYAQIPITSKESKRYLYKAPAYAKAAVPLEFGREVLARVMDKPDLAQWKACVQDEDKETELTAAFRESFSPYAPKEEE